MSEMSEYRQGVPCWVDLATSDRGAALDFYGAVFGWDFDEPTEQDAFTLARLRGKTVTGIFVPGRPGVPVAWTTYLATDDADTTAKAVTDHGGHVLTGPMDVADGVRVLVAVDPTGAVFGAWQGTFGAELVNEPGAPYWNELRTNDAPAARDFYAEIFGVHINTPMSDDFDYTTIQVDGRDVGAIGVHGDGTPPHWRVYFGVADTDATAAVVRAAGGRVDSEPTDTPFGRMAMFTDPQGGSFAVLSVSSG
jgi:predicted enzyme related to lactoylglutathione lyase